MSQPSPSVRDLRRSWKPFKESAPEETAVRMHRMFSWLARSQELPENSSENDAKLVWLWAAWNSIYGSWDEAGGKPSEDLPSQERCLKMLYEIDEQGQRYLKTFLIENKKLAGAL